MIFSRWKPSGGYDYFEAGHKAPLGDDLPIPALTEIANIGAPSTDIGRSLPDGARFVGSGRQAVGMVTTMAPAVKVRLEGSEIPVAKLYWLGVGAAIVGGAWWLSKRRRAS